MHHRARVLCVRRPRSPADICLILRKGQESQMSRYYIAVLEPLLQDQNIAVHYSAKGARRVPVIDAEVIPRGEMGTCAVLADLCGVARVPRCSTQNRDSGP